VINIILPEYDDAKSHSHGFSWSRLAHMKSMLESGQHEWVWCVGCDTLITNMSLAFEPLIEGTDKHVLICGERVAPLQADSFLVRASPDGIGWLADILALHSKYRHHVWVENQAMIDTRHKYAHLFLLIPQWRMNSYDYRRFYYLGQQYRSGTDCYGNRGQWIPGDFLVHWPAATLDERLKFLQEYKPQIVN